MKFTEIKLTQGAHKLVFHSRTIGHVRHLNTREGGNQLQVDFVNGKTLLLQSAVDISERLSYSRIFIVEGTRPQCLLITGGEIAYWLSDQGTVLQQVSLFRSQKDLEYWTTEFASHQNLLFLIYEAGILALNEQLEVLWHRKKYFNDIFVGFDGDVMKLVEDHENHWAIRVDTGASVTS